MRRREGAETAPRGRVRIIGGSWRGRPIAFAAVEGLRPTPDRVRETLFNWLQPVIEGARCLDLFCGSGALGLEALSRGAGSVVFVDSSARAIASLRATLEGFQATGADTAVIDALEWLARPSTARFDIVFVDPPYGSGLVEQVVSRLASAGAVTPGGLVYVETGRDDPGPETPPGWTLHRDKLAGQVRYRLFRVSPS